MGLGIGSGVWQRGKATKYQTIIFSTCNNSITTKWVPTFDSFSKKRIYTCWDLSFDGSWAGLFLSLSTHSSSLSEASSESLPVMKGKSSLHNTHKRTNATVTKRMVKAVHNQGNSEPCEPDF